VIDNNPQLIINEELTSTVGQSTFISAEIENFIKAMPEWQALLERSFLPEKKQDDFCKILIERSKRIGVL
jgi:hypothetical protein